MKILIWAKNKDIEESHDQDMEDTEDLPSSENSLEPRIVQRRYKAWKEGKEDALSKPLGRPRTIEAEGKLAEDTKSFATEYNKERPSATMDQLMKELTANFENPKLSKATFHRYMAEL
ncbi:hypothetical protein BCV72DRAFT_305642 [Rhizopus microsporus var. microsporus]|uniref:Uncharacterized protein n=2 Tax=Rhizopus microsporus TaxID=58291 RepID=A0A2G4T686_RHIZD|nr:uncharacterized protein RHIMIDRAFT_234133 [Rhizopus microsporus ATCC 52813]ORE06355.1 hypothetical protein BCV72DRAFT_305642 [Rhizopus microsporus var. microsporus]PHZ16530.1 hypothetical protein RHIMIDRAFT_234133 [Rhizopus microsporus ATCC 52813]